MPLLHCENSNSPDRWLNIGLKKQNKKNAPINHSFEHALFFARTPLARMTQFVQALPPFLEGRNRNRNRLAVAVADADVDILHTGLICCFQCSTMESNLRGSILVTENLNVV